MSNIDAGVIPIIGKCQTLMQGLFQRLENVKHLGG